MTSFRAAARPLRSLTGGPPIRPGRSGAGDPPRAGRRPAPLWPVAATAVVVAVVAPASPEVPGEGDPSPAPETGGAPRSAGHGSSPVLSFAELVALQARGDGFYFVLDAGAGSLTLLLDGAVLRTFPVGDVELGRPAWSARPSPDREALSARAWTDGRRDPPLERRRREIVVEEADPPDPAATEAVIPPMPEEQYPAPGRFRLRFEGGLALEIVAGRDRPREVAEGTAAAEAGEGTSPEGRSSSRRHRPSLGSRLAAAVAALGPGPRDAVRVRLRLPESEAGALYRSFPEGAALLVAPLEPAPEPPSAASSEASAGRIPAASSPGERA